MRGPPLSPVQESAPPKPLAHIWLQVKRIWRRGKLNKLNQNRSRYLSRIWTPSGRYSALHCLADTSSKFNTWQKENDNSADIRKWKWLRIGARKVIFFYLKQAWPLLCLSSPPSSHHQLILGLIQVRTWQTNWPECHAIKLGYKC